MTITKKPTTRTGDPDDPLLTIPEVAKRLRVNDTTVRTLIRRGTLKCSKVGNQFRFRRSWIEAYIDGLDTR
jgi:excisionase family DNA binding protein